MSWLVGVCVAVLVGLLGFLIVAFFLPVYTLVDVMNPDGEGDPDTE